MAGKWTGGVVTSMEEDEPPSVDSWTEVTVPGRPSAFAGEPGPIAYRTQFPDPRGDEEERTILELRGAHWRSRVWLNGQLLGEHDRPFRPARYEFAPEPENELVVTCGAPGVDQPSDDPDGWHPAGLPADVAVPAIHWDVTVGRRPPTFLREVSVRPRLTDDRAAIDVGVEVDSADGFDDAVTLSLRPEGFRGGGSMERVSVQADPGERASATKTLAVRDPSLWWPRPLGPQHRYTVTAKVDGHSVDRTVGLRRVERDEDGFVVNGRRVPARGIGRLPGGDETADVERALETNATLVRARGHVPSHAFYEACDEAGLLVWQDLPVAPTVDEERATADAEALVAAYGHHPSVVAYGVAEVPPESDPFADPLGSGRLAALRFRWRLWRAGYDRSRADAVAESLPDDVASIPVTGPPGTGADATTLYPGWRYLDVADVDWLLDRYPSLETAVGAFGAGTVDASAAESVDDVPGLDQAAIDLQNRTDADDESAQVRAVQTVAESLRRRGCGVLVADRLRDVSEVGGTGVRRSSGDPKPAADALARAYEPVQAVLDEPVTLAAPGSVGLTLLNDRPEPVEATVLWRAGDEGGERTVEAEAFGTVEAGTATIPGAAEGVELEVDLGDRTVRNQYHLS